MNENTTPALKNTEFITTFSDPSITMIVKRQYLPQLGQFMDFKTIVTMPLKQDNSLEMSEYQFNRIISTISDELKDMVGGNFSQSLRQTIIENKIQIEDIKMNNSLQLQPQMFTFELDTNIRMVVKENDPYFVVKDICDALDLSNSRQVIADLKANYESIEVNPDGVISTYTISDALGRMQETTIVSEVGLYDLVMQSRKPSALKFKHWISSEVLPSIRKTGRYSFSQNNGFNDEVISCVKKAMDFAKSLGLKGDKATQSTAHLVKESTGVDCFEILGIKDKMARNKGSIQSFISERCIVKSEVREKALNLYNAYVRYCFDNELISESKSIFRSYLLAQFKEKKTDQDRARRLLGITLK